MSESNESREEDDKKNEGKKRIRFKILKNAKKQENDVKNINDKTKRMQILRRIVCQKEYNELKSINNNSRDTSASSDISIDSSKIERDQIGSNTNNAVAFKSSSGFKNKLVRSLYKKFGRQCSIEKALEFFGSNEVLAGYFDDNFWDEILYVINLSNCTIKQLVEFKQNVVILANEKVSWLGNWLGPKMAPEKIKFAISPDMFQGLVYNSNPEKSFIDYLGDKKYQKRLDSFRVVLDGPNDDIKRESCGKLLDFILKDLEDDCQPVKDMIVLLQICRVLLCQKTIPVNVDGWKKIFSKIKSLSIKDFLKIRLLVDNPEVNLDDLEKFLFSKLNSKDDTQDEVKRFIAMFFPNDKIKSDDPGNRLYVFDLFIGCFPSQKLDFSFVTNFAEQNFNLGLSSLDIKDLVKVLSKVKSNSIDLKNFESIVKVIRDKKFSVNKEEDVVALQQLLCAVLRISGKELGFSNVMDLFLLYPKMPELCKKSTLANKSLKLALENINKISAIGSSNENFNDNKDEFRSKFKDFISLFKDDFNKIKFADFKSLILAIPDDYLDFECLDCVLQKTDIKNHGRELCEFFETDVLKKISQYKFDLNQLRCFFDQYLSSKSVKNYKFTAATFECIIDNTIQFNCEKECCYSNKDIEWLLEKCFNVSFKLEKDKFVKLIEKGEKANGVAKIELAKMCSFMNEIVSYGLIKEIASCGLVKKITATSVKPGILNSRKMEFKELCDVLSRTECRFDKPNLGGFLKNILTLKEFVTGNELFKVILCFIPSNSISDLNMLKKIVYYCFEDVESYNQDIQVPHNYFRTNKSKFKLSDDITYKHLLEAFADDSLSYDDFKALNNDFFGKQESSNFLDFLFSLFGKHESNTNISNIDHMVLKKKLKKEVLSSDQIQELFKKFGTKFSIDQFVELLMLAKDESLTEDDVISLFNNYCNEEMPLEANKYKKASSIKDEKSLLEKAEINTNSIDETYNKNEIINIDDNIPSFSNAKNESLISHRTSANPKATVPVNLVKSINIEQKNYFDMVTRKINGMKNVQELKKRLQKSNTEKRWMKLLDDIDDDFSLLFRLNSEMLADKYQLFVEEYQKHKKDNSNNSNVDSKHLSIKIDVNGNTNNLDFNLNGVVNNEHEDYMDYERFKADFFMLWGRLDKKRQRYIQVIFGHKTRLWPTAVCWCFSYMFFYPGLLVCYLLGLAMILFFTFKFIDKMVRRGLVGVAHGEKPSFLIEGNKCIKEALRCKDLEQTYSASKIEEKSLLKIINPAKDKILSVMVPNMESGKLGSFMDELSSLKNGAIHVFDLVKNRVF